MPDLERVRQKSSDIREAVQSLRQWIQRPAEEFLTDDLVLAAAKYKLLVAIEAALDLCNHLCAKRLSQAPDTYAECFFLLAAGNVIEEEIAERLALMARFRNLLVHQYADIDDQRVLSFLQNNLIDLDQYLAEVGRYLNTEL